MSESNRATRLREENKALIEESIRNARSTHEVGVQVAARLQEQGGKIYSMVLLNIDVV
jgi:hypothetical protein